MKLEDFNNIDFKNAGSLPVPVKLVLLSVLSLILIGMGYWFLWSPEIDELEQAKAKEQELRQTFLAKKAQAVKIEAYKQQMIDIEKIIEPDRIETIRKALDAIEEGISTTVIKEVLGDAFSYGEIRLVRVAMSYLP